MKFPEVITVFTNDNSLWLLNGFQYLFRKYWSQNIELRIVGYAPPKAGLLNGNTSFMSIDRRNYPASEWSSGILRSLDVFLQQGEEFLVFLLEDYWLTKKVNLTDFASLWEFMHKSPRDILRIDLTADRCQHRRYRINTVRHRGLDVIETSADSPYQMSFQAGIWNIELLKEVLRPHENPWLSEIKGSERLAEAGSKYRVLGTTSPPVHYQPVYRSQRGTMNIEKLSEEDQQMILKRGWI
jgi:hypothetical protein